MTQYLQYTISDEQVQKINETLSYLAEAYKTATGENVKIVFQKLDTNYGFIVNDEQQATVFDTTAKSFAGVLKQAADLLSRYYPDNDIPF